MTGFSALGISRSAISAKNRSRLNYPLAFSSAQRSLWGIGYHAGRDNRETSYTEKRYQIETRYVPRILPNTYLGVMLGFEHTKGRGFDALGESYIEGQKHSYTATGIGLIAENDSRDFIPNPFRGIYVSLEHTSYPPALGNCGHTTWRTPFTADA